MKILFLTRRFYPDIGGVEKHVLEISKVLLKHGHQVVILTESKSKKHKIKNSNHQLSGLSDKQGIISEKTAKSIQSDIFEPKKINVIRLDFGKDNGFKKLRIWIQIVKKYRLILAADIIHCHDVFFWYYPFKVLLPYKKCFITFHGYESYPIPIKNILHHKISEFLSSGNICVGKYLEKWYGTKANKIIYGGVVKNNARLRKYHRKKKNIIYVGRIDKDNGIEIYLNTLKLLKKKKKNFNFSVIGNGSYSNKLRKFGTVHGFVEDVKKYIVSSDIVFASSYLSIIESLSYGKEVYAVYNNPLKEDYLRMTPFSKYIHIIHSSKELYNLVVSNGIKFFKGYEWAQNQSWEKVVNYYYQLWKNE